jgi:HAE1 family hydrophobic/amphiphilic exporter-1
MFSDFFIHRPKFAFVISIVLTLAGLLSIPLLPVAKFPEISPPTIQVSASYPGANAEAVKDSVAGPLEAGINGVENMIYMSSNSAGDGSYRLTITFAIGTDADMAQVQVQNRVQRAMPMLPAEVTRLGVSVDKRSSNMLMVVNLLSPGGSFDRIFLSNYASINIKDNLARIDGLSDVGILGDLEYGMRIWMNPDQMAALKITSSDVVTAIREQNVLVAAGQLGAPPSADDQQFQYTLQVKGRLENPVEFGGIVLRALPDGGAVYLRDVARIELGAQSYKAFGQVDQTPSTVMALYQQPGANAIDVAQQVRAEMERLKIRFPVDLDYAILYDSTRFVEASIEEVYKTLLIAVLLVVLVVYVFLQDWRSTLVPAVAIPVSLIGTYAFLFAAGMSINTVSLFALVLAIGIVVDDAIIVIENVRRIMVDEGLAAEAATRVAMRQVTGPIIATTLVLLAVFLPVALMPGITGRMYSQFSLTLSIAVVISSINALTLSPALCATLLKPRSGEVRGLWQRVEGAISGVTRGYTDWVTVLVHNTRWVALATLLVLGALAYLAITLPKNFVPNEDQGYFMIDVQLPDAASLQRTTSVLNELTDLVLAQPGVAHTITVPGYSLLSGSSSSNGGMMIVNLDDWSLRPGQQLSQQTILGRVRAALYAYPFANAMAFEVPPIPGLGRTGGVEFVLQDTLGRTPQALGATMRALVLRANDAPEIGSAFSTFRADIPQLFVDVNRRKAQAMGVPLGEIFATMQAHLGSLYVNDFNKYGKSYQVKIQADTEYRANEADLQHLHVRSSGGDMVPLGTLIETYPILGAEITSRYNMYSSAQINASPAAGYSSSEAISAIERLVRQALPDGYAYQWTGITFQQLEAGNLVPVLFALALLFVYLFLVAQYESWSIPLAIILCVPLALLGALLAIALTGTAINLYSQIGMVLLIGLASKNAILIVEFARVQRERERRGILESAVNAARLRFRAVIMTALSFILGVLPLVFASGAGAASRMSLGLGVFGGMLMAALVGTLLVPAFYVMIQTGRERFHAPSIKSDA